MSQVEGFQKPQAPLIYKKKKKVMTYWAECLCIDETVLSSLFRTFTLNGPPHKTFSNSTYLEIQQSTNEFEVQFLCTFPW